MMDEQELSGAAIVLRVSATTPGTAGQRVFDILLADIQIGTLTATDAPARRRRARTSRVEIEILPSWRGQGHGTDAIQALVRDLSDNSQIDRLEASVPPSDGGIATCFERSGFRQVGLARRAARDATGVWRDAILLEYRFQKTR